MSSSLDRAGRRRIVRGWNRGTDDWGRPVQSSWLFGNRAVADVSRCKQFASATSPPGPPFQHGAFRSLFTSRIIIARNPECKSGEHRNGEAAPQKTKTGMTIQEVTADFGSDAGGDCLVEYGPLTCLTSAVVAKCPSQVLLQSTASTKTASKHGLTLSREYFG